MSDEIEGGWTDKCEELVGILRDKELSWQAETVKNAIVEIEDVNAYRPDQKAGNVTFREEKEVLNSLRKN